MYVYIFKGISTELRFKLEEKRIKQIETSMEANMFYQGFDRIYILYHKRTNKHTPRRPSFQYVLLQRHRLHALKPGLGTRTLNRRFSPREGKNFLPTSFAAQKQQWISFLPIQHPTGNEGDCDGVSRQDKPFFHDQPSAPFESYAFASTCMSAVHHGVSVTKEADGWMDMYGLW